jgi:peptidoglycan/LPS O-acetylase OafA/YrhL
MSTSGMEQSSSGRFRELDVLRGLAALGVVFFHYTFHGTRYYAHYPFWFWAGEYGVHLFFVISGFVIYYTIERSRTVGDFLFSRFSRLYPAYWVALGILLVWAVLDPAQHPVWWSGYLINATMMQKFVYFPDVDEVYWSLAVELIFYAVMTLVFLTGQMRRIVWVSLAWLAAGLVWGLNFHFVVAGNEHSIGNAYFILPYAPYFIAGMMFYRMYSERRARLLYVVPIVCGAFVIWVIQGTLVFEMTVAIFALFALAVSGWLRFLVNPVTLWLGAISYPLYLVHREPGYALLDWLYAHHVSHWLSLGIAVPLALLAGYVLSIAVERPAMRLLRSWYRARGGHAHPVARTLTGT